MLTINEFVAFLIIVITNYIIIYNAVQNVDESEELKTYVTKNKLFLLILINAAFYFVINKVCVNTLDDYYKDKFTSLSNEAVQDSGSILNSGNLIVDNITVKNTATLNNCVIPNTGELTTPSITFPNYKMVDAGDNFYVARKSDKCAVWILNKDAKTYTNTRSTIPSGWGCGDKYLNQ